MNPKPELSAAHDPRGAMTFAGSAAALAPLKSGPRLLRMSVAWLLLVCAGPGFLTGNGSLALALVGVSLWGATVLRPYQGQRRWAFLGEFLPNAIGSGSWMAWVWYVYPGAFAYVCLGFGLHWTLTSFAVRWFAKRLSPGSAVALGILACETLRSLTPPPFGLGWLQFGHFSHHHLAISGSARIWGLVGLSWVVLSLGGLGAALLLGDQRSARGEPRLRPVDLIWGLGPLGLALLLAFLAPDRGEREGPGVLLVQPGFTQERKQAGSRDKNFETQALLTQAALAELASAGQRPDLVLWAESMLTVMLLGESALDAALEGITGPSWSQELSPEVLEDLRDWELDWVHGILLGQGPYAGANSVIPQETAFLAGAEVFMPYGEGDQRSLRRRVCTALYGPASAASQATETADGIGTKQVESPNGLRQRSLTLKRHLVPGAETMLGLEARAWVRDTIMTIAGYIPDFVPGQGQQVLELQVTGGKSWRFGSSICFDNAFLDTFVDVFESPQGELLAAPLDFHVVASNEAWYRGSFEMDQMVAFSRIAALATERAVVRVTNSGVSVVIAAGGEELGRIRDEDGRDRACAGSLFMKVPVPLAEHRSLPSPYVKMHSPWLLLGLLAPFLALAVAALGRQSSKWRYKNGVGE